MINEKMDLSKSSGFLKLKITKNGKLVREESHNLILDSSENIIAGLLAGNDASKITHIHFGNSDTVVTSGMTTLAGLTFAKTIKSASSSGNVATILFKLETDEWNGNNIWQFALANAAGDLFSAVSRSGVKTYPIEKDSEVSVEGEWNITVVI